jgi:hypothetical protein
MLYRVRLTMIVFLGALLMFVNAAGAQERPDVSGTWHSLSIERTVGGNYMRRLFTFSGDEWEVIYMRLSICCMRTALYHAGRGALRHSRPGEGPARCS